MAEQPLRRNRLRWWHRLRANLGGYFWIPCPLCGEMFGGHEWSGAAIYPWPNDLGHGIGICRACEREGKAEKVVRHQQTIRLRRHAR
jgi:hypothetical protein